ncbi:unnamed protein product [Effrenium voratum]|uniref:Uncharacterized protein n=1 Tax=Effrenium voratum TaxID=2562239 RepID=A0AA36J664_9DINO|nr:unnamed protein product [Effrenium voratum]CAJ1429293.1 unnamed protein product [Effrenium voratum]
MGCRVFALSGLQLLELSPSRLAELQGLEALKDLLAPRLGAASVRLRLLAGADEVSEWPPPRDLQVVVLPWCQHLARELLLAAGGGDVAAVGRLLRAPQDPNGGALHAAARNGHVEVLQSLLAASAALDLRGAYEATALLEAAERGHLPSVRCLAEARANLDLAGLGCTTPLLAAAERGRLDVVRFLLAKGADKEAADARGVTPLLASLGHLQLTELLLEAKAELNTPEKDGKTRYAWQRAWATLTLRVAYWRPVQTPIGLLWRKPEARASLNCPDALGVTALWAAARNARLDVVHYLLQQQHVDKDAPDIDSETPLRSAAEHGHFEVARALLAARADLELPGAEGRAPLRAAAQHGHHEVVQCLLASRAALDASCENGRTPLRAAAEAGQLVSRLISAKADSTKSDEGMTPLHAAAGKGHLRLLPLLTDTLEARDHLGATPLWRAARAGQVEAVKFLAEHGADTDCFVNTGQTALQAATERCHSQVVNFLREAADDVRKPAKRCRLSDQSVAFRCAQAEPWIEKCECYGPRAQNELTSCGQNKLAIDEGPEECPN